MRLDGEIVGTTIVGVLHNRHHALLDEFQQLFGAEALSVYAYDWRVNTNIDAGDGTRAIGTLAPRPGGAAGLAGGTGQYLLGGKHR